ncbi:MAG TPA: hypothetical protein VHA07_01325 [Devosia sp.]|nr:hypothetical protein [Devosia sp.]
MTGARGRVVIESGALSIAIDTAIGGTIATIEHKGCGASILGRVPWTPEAQPPANVSAPDESAWLRHYTGGWPLLFPNAGDACRIDDVFHGFHGEASLARWRAETRPTAVRLTHRFATVPVEMEREIALEGEMLTIRERVRMLGSAPIRVMWGHHPSFGSDLLAGPVEIRSGARHVLVDDRYDPASNPLRPGASGAWPRVPGKTGIVDLSRPAGPMASLAYLQDFDSAWVSIQRRDGFVGVALSWDTAVFPCAWLWCELEGTADPPWNGKTRLIGVEPSTTWPGNGLAEALRRQAPLLTLQPGTEIETAVRLHVFKPGGPVRAVDAKGCAVFSA